MINLNKPRSKHLRRRFGPGNQKEKTNNNNNNNNNLHFKLFQYSISHNPLCLLPELDPTKLVRLELGRESCETLIIQQIYCPNP